ncbi:MAG: Dessication-associated protein [Flavipsychrobacter sp.]|nr:Dessication-associated protein [Flavipsychrobacter sp.]
MDFKNILNELEQAGQKINGRRELLTGFGSKVMVAALPFAVGSLFQKASAKTTAPDTVPQALNFILEMEYFAYNYYHTGNNTGGLIPAANQAGFLTIENQKKAHINYLNTVITAMGVAPFTPKNYDASAANPLYIVSGAYDFTAAGKYLVFSDYPTFIMMCEVFEDTFIRGYKGEIPAVLGDKGTLELMMRMQSSVGRHASHARYVRRLLGYTSAPEHPSPWITDNIPPDVRLQAYYDGEDAVGQQGVDISGLSGSTGAVPHYSATAAFDEAYDKSVVLSLLSPFKT